MRRIFRRVISLLVSVIMCASIAAFGVSAADTLNSYNFNDDTSGRTPHYIEGDAIVSSQWLDASEGKTAAFSMPEDAERTRFISKVKADDTFLLTLYDGDEYEEIRITPKTNDSGMLYIVVNDGDINVVYANEQIENRKSNVITNLTKVQIKNARIDNVKVGDMDISAMPVNLHMYKDDDSVNLGYITFAPDGGDIGEIYANWYTDDGGGQFTDYGTGMSVEIPDSEYIGCGVLYGKTLVGIPAKKVSDLDMLIYDYSVVTTYNNETGKQAGITLKRNVDSGWDVLPAIADWSDYDNLVLRATSENASGRVYQTNINTSNPDNQKAYFFTFFETDWENSQKDIVLPIGLEASLDSTENAVWNNVTSVDLKTFLTTEQSEEEILTDTERQTRVTYAQAFLRKGNIADEFTDSEYIINGEKTAIDEYDYANSIIENQHPRILLTEDKLESLRTDIEEDAYLEKTYNALKNSVEESMTEGVVSYEESNRAKEIAQAALLYNLSPDDGLKEWIDSSVEGLISSERTEWNYDSSSYLLIGDTTREMALVYDWMYNHWTQEQRLKMRNAIMHHGIEPAIRTLRAGTRWAGAGYGNWNQAILSGVGMGALSICDSSDYRVLTNELLNRIIKSLRYGLRDIDENGAHIEGVAYWHYAMDTFIPFEAALSSICGTNSGLLDETKMAETGYFPIVMTGPQGIFSFADAYYPSNVRTAAFYRLSEYFDNPVFGAYQYTKSDAAGGGDYLSMLLYDTNGYGDYQQYMPSYKYYPGDTESFVMRKSWGIMDSYLAFKGGKNGISHSQLDIGTFVYDKDNVRWICDLGRDSYIDYNNKTKYYRNRAEGNNCIVINPDDGIDQVRNAMAEIIGYEVTDEAGYAIIDMSGAYEDTTSVKRGFMMKDNFETLIIQDEITADGLLETVYSFMHTHQNIELSADKKSAVLICNESGKTDRKVYVKLLSNCNAELSVMEAVLLSGDVPETQFENGRYKKLAVKAENVENPIFTVVISTQENVDEPQISPIENWSENPLFQD